MYPRQFLITFLLLSTLTNCSINTNPSIDTKTDKKQLLEAIHKFNKAFEKGDIEVLSSMIPDNYQHTNGNSKSIGKSDWLNYLEKRKQEIQSGNLIVNSYEMTETQIEIFGNSAIVTAKIEVSSTKNGTESENAYRVTNIWVKENDTWKRAGFHDGKIQ